MKTGSIPFKDIHPGAERFVDIQATDVINESTLFYKLPNQIENLKV